MNRANLPAEERERRIVEAWRDRPERNRSADDALPFYGWLLVHRSELIRAWS